MNKPIAIAFLLLASVFLLAGCLGGGTPATNQTNTTTPAPKPSPSFSIAEPVSGDSIPSTDDAADVSVAVSVSNIALKPAGTPNADGQGHFRVSLDGGDYYSFYTKSYTLAGVPIGTHSVTVEFVNNDGTPLSPPLKRTVSFEVIRYVPPVYVPEDYEVNIQDFSYDPSSLTVKVGDRVTFNNVGNYPRSATATGVFDTTVLAPGGSATITMDKEGTFTYFSLTYVQMKGTMIVESNGTAVDTGSP